MEQEELTEQYLLTLQIMWSEMYKLFIKDFLLCPSFIRLQCLHQWGMKYIYTNFSCYYTVLFGYKTGIRAFQRIAFLFPHFACVYQMMQKSWTTQSNSPVSVDSCKLNKILASFVLWGLQQCNVCKEVLSFPTYHSHSIGSPSFFGPFIYLTVKVNFARVEPWLMQQAC